MEVLGCQKHQKHQKHQVEIVGTVITFDLLYICRAGLVQRFVRAQPEAAVHDGDKQVVDAQVVWPQQHRNVFWLLPKHVLRFLDVLRNTLPSDIHGRRQPHTTHTLLGGVVRNKFPSDIHVTGHRSQGTGHTE